MSTLFQSPIAFQFRLLQHLLPISRISIAHKKIKRKQDNNQFSPFPLPQIQSSTAQLVLPTRRRHLPPLTAASFTYLKMDNKNTVMQRKLLRRNRSKIPAIIVPCILALAILTTVMHIRSTSTFMIEDVSHAHDTNTAPEDESLKIHIIISHCKADLHWISKFTKGFNISSLRVITKCNRPVQGAPDIAIIESLPNVGRCDHSYAKYITKDLDHNEKNSVVVFLKDDMSKANLHQGGNWNNFATMLHEASSIKGFSCGRIPEKTPYDTSEYHNAKEIFKFSIGEHGRNTGRYEDDGVAFKSEFKNLGLFLGKVLHGNSTQELVPVCYGGVFAAAVPNIKKVDMSVWDAAERALHRGDNIEEGHFMERSWAMLLSTPLQPIQIDLLNQHYYHHGLDCPNQPNMPGMLCHKVE